MPATRPPLPALTGLRFLAALHVVLLHFTDLWKLEGPAAVRNVIASGAVGVTLFFVLSGFVLAYNYLGEDGSLAVGRREFWVARFARVYPAYVLAFLAFTPVYLADQALFGGRATVEGSAPTVLATLTLTQAWHPDLGRWNGPAWSLSCEAFFYALFPVLAPLVARLTARRPRRTLAALYLVALAPSVATALAAGTLTPGYPWASYVLPLARLPEFLLGVALGALFLRRDRSHDVRWGNAALLAGAGQVAWLAVAGSSLSSGLLGIVLLPAFGLLVWGLACGGGDLGRLLSRPTMLLLGEASYAVYLLHVTVLAAAHAVLLAALGEGEGPPVAALLLLVLAAVTVVSILVFLAVERPARRWLRALLAGRSDGRAGRVLPGAS